MKPAVCSWSIQPTSCEDLVTRMKDCGLSRVQLALGPLCEQSSNWHVKEIQSRFAAESFNIVSGMMAAVGEDYTSLETIKQTGGLLPDHHWEANKQLAIAHADVAKQLGLNLVTTHVGFLPHDTSSQSNRQLRERMIERIAEIATIFASQDIAIALETGQESAETLAGVLRELMQHQTSSDLAAPIGVNFDPANMILYGMGEPVHSLITLAPWVKQIHIKDATPSTNPKLNGGWGTEVVAGTGAVDWNRFFQVVQERVPTVNLVIEREAGNNRIADVRTAAALIEKQLNT